MWEAKRIDSIISIYELLAEMSGRLSAETLEAAVMIPDILTFLYGEWLKYEDSYTADIRYCLDKELAKLRRDYRDMKGRYAGSIPTAQPCRCIRTRPRMKPKKSTMKQCARGGNLRIM